MGDPVGLGAGTDVQWWNGTAYTDLGNGRPVVLLHGFMFSHAMWHEQWAPLLAAGFRVIALDLPGFGVSNFGAGNFGVSNPAGGAVTMATYSEAVSGLMQHLGTGPAAVVGYSMGGQVAMDLLARHPGLVERIMLVDTSAAPDSADKATERRALADRLEREGVAEYTEEFLPLLVRMSVSTPQMDDLARAMMLATVPRGAADASRARADRPDYRDVLASCSTPALVVAGEHDPFDRGGASASMAECLPHGERVIVPGVGHTPPIEAPELFNQLLLDFLGCR